MRLLGACAGLVLVVTPLASRLDAGPGAGAGVRGGVLARALPAVDQERQRDRPARQLRRGRPRPVTAPHCTGSPYLSHRDRASRRHRRALHEVASRPLPAVVHACRPPRAAWSRRFLCTPRRVSQRRAERDPRLDADAGRLPSSELERHAGAALLHGTPVPGRSPAQTGLRARVEEYDVDRKAHEHGVHRPGATEQHPFAFGQVARPSRPRRRVHGRSAMAQRAQS